MIGKTRLSSVYLAVLALGVSIPGCGTARSNEQGQTETSRPELTPKQQALWKEQDDRVKAENAERRSKYWQDYREDASRDWTERDFVVNAEESDGLRMLEEHIGLEKELWHNHERVRIILKGQEDTPLNELHVEERTSRGDWLVATVITLRTSEDYRNQNHASCQITFSRPSQSTSASHSVRRVVLKTQYIREYDGGALIPSSWKKTVYVLHAENDLVMGSDIKPGTILDHRITEYKSIGGRK